MDQKDRPQQDTVHSRVRINLDIQKEPGQGELPFVIGVFADFRGSLTDDVPLRDRSFVEVDATNFEAVLRHCEPVMRHGWVVPQGRHGGEEFHSVALQFKSMEDFEPEALARVQPQLAKRILESEFYGRLASAWYGLRYLVDRAGPSPLVKIRMLDARKMELWHDLCKSESVHQTALFRMLHDDIFTVRGRAPFSMLIVDLGFDCDEDEVKLISKLSELAATVHAPLLIEARPEMFNCDLEKLKSGRAPRAIRDESMNEDFAQAWELLRENDSARFAYLTLPRISLRCRDGEHLWGNAAYGIAGKVLHAFLTDGWFASVAGSGAGTLDRMTAEFAMDEECAWEWTRAGYCALCSTGPDARPYPAGLPSYWMSDKFEDVELGEFLRYSTALPYNLTISRFAQCLMVLVRDGGMNSLKETEAMLNHWLSRHVDWQEGEGEGNGSTLHPLRSANLQVIPGGGDTPDLRKAACFLHPIYLLRDFGRGSRLVIDLPAPVAGV
jgi:type VI secretion system protein ImpC